MRREVLEKPFPAAMIRHRPGRNGGSLAYVEAHHVITRLNESFDSAWTWEVVRDDVRDDEVIVLGRLTAGGVSKMAYGSSSITRSRDDSAALCLGDDLKSAATDAMKKASTMLGIGLHLYGGTATTNTEPTNASSRGNTSRRLQPSDQTGPSAAQVRAIHALRRRLEWTDADLHEWLASALNVPDMGALDKARASRTISELQAQLRTRHVC